MDFGGAVNPGHSARAFKLKNTPTHVRRRRSNWLTVAYRLRWDVNENNSERLAR